MIHSAEDATKDNSTIQLNIMLNYGGRREIVDAVKRMLITVAILYHLMRMHCRIVCTQEGCRILIF